MKKVMLLALVLCGVAGNIFAEGEAQVADPRRNHRERVLKRPAPSAHESHATGEKRAHPTSVRAPKRNIAQAVDSIREGVQKTNRIETQRNLAALTKTPAARSALTRAAGKRAARRI